MVLEELDQVDAATVVDVICQVPARRKIPALLEHWTNPNSTSLAVDSPRENTGLVAVRVDLGKILLQLVALEKLELLQGLGEVGIDPSRGDILLILAAILVAAVLAVAVTVNDQGSRRIPIKDILHFTKQGLKEQQVEVLKRNMLCWQ